MPSIDERDRTTPSSDSEKLVSIAAASERRDGIDGDGDAGRSCKVFKMNFAPVGPGVDSWVRAQ